MAFLVEGRKEGGFPWENQEKGCARTRMSLIKEEGFESWRLRQTVNVGPRENIYPGGREGISNPVVEVVHNTVPPDRPTDS